MPRNHFSLNEQKIHQRVIVLKELIANQEIHTEPCQLLLNQLNEIGVLSSLLQKNIKELADCTTKAIQDK